MGNRKIAAVLISAAVGVTPYLTAAWPFFLLFAVPVFYLLYSDAGRREFRFYHFVICCLIVNEIAMIPVLRVGPRAYLTAVLMSSSYSSAVLLLSKLFIKRFNKKRFVIFVPVFFWISINILMDYRFMMEAVYNIGVQMPPAVPLVWYVGSTGITFLIILFNSAVAYYLYTKDGLVLKLALAILAVFGACAVYGLTVNPAQIARGAGPIKIALVQGNVHEPLSPSRDDPFSVRRTYETLSLAAAREKPDLIVWPEYAVPADILKYNRGIRRAVEDVVRKGKTKFLIGSIICEQLGMHHEDSALLFSAGGELKGYYASVEPAPFNAAARPSREPLHLVDGAGVMVCWEELGRSTARSLTKMGARYLIVLANDQDLDYTWMQSFASAYSRSRAAENMRFLARATNTGVTQIVSPVGRVMSSLPSGERGFLAGEIYPVSKKTFYTRYGDLLVLTALFVILSNGVYLLICTTFAGGKPLK